MGRLLGQDRLNAGIRYCTLVDALGANLQDMTTRFVFADWLDDHGRTDEAEVLRNCWACLVITPFRVLPYWRKAAFFTRLFRLNGRTD